MKISVIIHLAKGYIAHPYWPEREKLINVQKQSGLNRARTEDRRAKALSAWLGVHKMSREDYDELVRLAERPFYTRDGTAEIVIPAHQLHGMLAQASALCPSSIRIARPEQVRSLVEFSDFSTGRTKADGIWERFVPVKSGTGQTLSNQRGLRSDPYLTRVDASGTLSVVNPEIEQRIRDFLEWAGLEVGVGAARKMGWGRFVVREWKRTTR